MSKKHLPPKTVVAAVAAAARQEEITSFGKIISFRSIKQKSKKTYSRKKKHKNEHS